MKASPVCTRCSETMGNVADLAKHLVRAHDVEAAEATVEARGWEIKVKPSPLAAHQKIPGGSDVELDAFLAIYKILKSLTETQRARVSTAVTALLFPEPRPMTNQQQAERGLAVMRGEG